jgi:hypothetical protein
MIYLWLLAMLVFPVSSQATVFWDDELESGNTGYNLSLLDDPAAMTFDTSVKYSGSASLRYNYPSVCWPDASAQINCGGFIDRGFATTQTLFTRAYVMLSAGFHVADTYTKLFRSDTDDSNFSNWWTIGCCETAEINVHWQNVPFGDTTRLDSGFVMSDGVWYCIETQETLSTPGGSDGISRLWVDGVQYINVTNLQSRASGNTSLFNNKRLYRQIGTGNIWFDRLAVGDTRIGCLAGGGSTSGGGLDF